MRNRPTPEFYYAEAERLLQAAAVTTDRATRVGLLEQAARYRQIAAQLHGEHAMAANAHATAANANDDDESKTA